MYLQLSIREGSAGPIDSMHKVTVNWFLVTNKFNYSRICVGYAYPLLELDPRLLQIWQKYRTCSLTGNSGRRVTWDQVAEFQNLDLKTSTPTSPAHIDKIMTLLNGLNAAEQHLRATVGEERSEPTENSDVKQKHIQAIVGSLKHKLGANRDTLFNNATSVSNNRFGDQQRPWMRVKTPAGLQNASEQEIHDEAVRWVLRQLGDSPFPAENI